MKVGQVIGSTDKLGGAAASHPVHYLDVLATIYHNLGIDPHAFISDKANRPVQYPASVHYPDPRTHRVGSSPMTPLPPPLPRNLPSKPILASPQDRGKVFLDGPLAWQTPNGAAPSFQQGVMTGEGRHDRPFLIRGNIISMMASAHGASGTSGARRCLSGL